MNDSVQIYFHVGLSKTGSTYLQKKFFPILKDIYYLPTVKYRNALKIIPSLNASKIVISREFDQQFYKEVDKFSATHPKAKPIIVLREHGAWIASQYKRFIKNGHSVSFQEFIDIENDKGIFKILDLNFSHKIEYLEQKFEHPPLVLLFEELKNSPQKYLTQITDYLNVSVNWEKICFEPNHTSYSKESLLVMRKMSKYIPLQKKLEIHRNTFGYLYNLYANIMRYMIMYSAKLLPQKSFENKILISDEEIENIRAFCQEDWKKVQAYASQQNYEFAV